MIAVEIQSGSIVRGPTLPEPIEVLATVPFGDSVKVIGRGLNRGMTHSPVLSPDQLRQLEISADRQPFDGDARMSRLGIAGIVGQQEPDARQAREVPVFLGVANGEQIAGTLPMR